jgi:hypothetical protein
MKTSVEPLTESAESFAKRFAELNATWKEETRHSSKMKTRMEHPAFREIVAMGEKAVPLILAELEKNGGFGFLTLHEITGADPVPVEAAGKIGEIAAAWIVGGSEYTT